MGSPSGWVMSGLIDPGLWAGPAWGFPSTRPDLRSGSDLLNRPRQPRNDQRTEADRHGQHDQMVSPEPHDGSSTISASIDPDSSATAAAASTGLSISSRWLISTDASPFVMSFDDSI